MGTDWYENGVTDLIKLIAVETGPETNTVSDVYSELVNQGLIDYDIEKDVIREKQEEGGLPSYE